MYIAWNTTFFVWLIAGTKSLYNRYKIDVDGQCGKMYVSAGWLLFSLGLCISLKIFLGAYLGEDWGMSAKHFLNDGLYGQPGQRNQVCQK